MTYTSWSATSDRTVERNRVEKWPASAETSSTVGWGSETPLAKWSSEENGVVRTTSSTTAICPPATVVWSIPNGGRSWVSRDRLIIS